MVMKALRTPPVPHELVVVRDAKGAAGGGNRGALSVFRECSGPTGSFLQQVAHPFDVARAALGSMVAEEDPFGLRPASLVLTICSPLSVPVGFKALARLKQAKLRLRPQLPKRTC